MTKTLRVLHIASGDLWAGAEVQAFTLMSHLKRTPGTDVSAVLMNEGTLANKLRSVGIPVYVTDEQSATSLGILSQLREVLRRWRPDIVHTHRVKENVLGSLASRSCRNVACIRTVHGAEEHLGLTGLKGVRHRMITGIDRWCGRVLQQKVIAVTQDLAVQMRVEFPEPKIAVIENGVDAEEVTKGIGVAEFRAAQPDATHIGIAGRLAGVKRVDLFLETAALLLRQCPERAWRFHVFGDGPLRASLEELSVRMQIADKVTFHGERLDIATCIAALDGLVNCSDHEGMPMVALEAAALAVPTVAHAVGGLVQVVPEEFLVVRHTACGYRDAILRALRTDSRTITARRSAETLIQFSAQRNAERVRALYVKVLEERRDKWADG